MPFKLMLSAAEVSADVHGAVLAEELKKLDKDIVLFGMGGERMAAAGVNVKLDITDKSTVGFVEPLKHLPTYFKALRTLVRLLKKEKPDALVVIDAQGFHMPLAKKAKKLGIKTIYYIAPQEWLWGTEKGVKKVVETIDLLIAAFQKEHDIYKNAGGNVIYFGHPVVDIARPSHSKEELRSASSVAKDAPFVGIFPGSRQQEVEKLLPMMLDAIKMIENKLGKVNPVIGLSSPKFRKRVEELVEKRNMNLSIVEGGTYETLAASDVSLASAGTLLLEAAVVGAPIIMTYKLAPLSYFIGKYIFKIDKKISFYSMPNIMANERIIPEYVLSEATAENLASEAVSILSDRVKSDNMKHGLNQVAALLGEPGVVSRVARGIIDFISQPKS